MDFALTEEQELLQNMVREFAQKEVEPCAADLDKECRFPADLVGRMAELGLMGIPFPEEYDGTDMGTIAFSIAVEEISRACASTGCILSTHIALGAQPINQWGNEEQKQKYLTKLASGEYLGAFCLTEPGAGTDAGAVATTAVKDGDKYILNGTKIFISNGGQADTYIVIAKTQMDIGAKGLSAFIVEKDFPGFVVGQKEIKMGINASETREIIFKNCEVPAENLIGKEGDGFKIAMTALDLGRIGIGSQALGIAQASLDASVKYAKEREQFGRPIAKFQAIQWMIADMGVKVAASRHLLRHAAWMRDQGQRYSMEAAMGKLHASETAMWAATKAVQVHGGHGFTTQYPVERFMRDAKITEIYEGTSEVMRMVVSGSLLS
jgi:butyryl-CoA dehydrogenase